MASKEDTSKNVEISSTSDAMDVSPEVDTGAKMQTDMESFVMKVALTAETKEMRHLSRALRHSFSEYRRKWTPVLLAQLIIKYFPEDSAEKSQLLTFFTKDNIQDAQKALADAKIAAEKAAEEKAAKLAAEKAEAEKAAAEKAAAATNNSKSEKTSEKTPAKVEKPEKEKPTEPTEFYPEVEVYLSLLLQVWLMDNKRVLEAKTLTTALLARLQSWNRRTLDSLSAKVYFYYARVYELLGSSAEIRPLLFSLHRTAVLHHNVEGQTALLNILLRNFLSYNLYEQANKLVSNTEFKENTVSSNEVARYYYYQGRILSIDPEKYGPSFEYLQQALRKAPSSGALGFRAAVNKLAIIVQLLIGDIPERSVFRQRGLTTPLAPYFQLTRAVRFGDLSAFEQCVKQHYDQFVNDNTITLIHRLRNNVIRIALRKINISYSRISIKDISEKLNLDNLEDVEFIVAKAIKEGVIDAKIVHSDGVVTSKDTLDVYSSRTPQEEFHMRTEFFLGVHNDAMKAMRYRPDSSKKLDDEDLAQKMKDEEELMAVFAEEDFDDF